MIQTLTLSREEFAAKRRELQVELEEALRPHVVRALDRRQATDGWREVLNVAETLYREVYRSEAGDTPTRYPRQWRNQLLETLRKTTDPRTEATVERISIWLATNIMSAATVQAASDDPDDVALEWVTMHDNDVRAAHKAVDGHIRPIGVPFRVDGHDMMRPGDTSAPVSLWINCRCTLRPTYLEEDLVAAGAPSDKSTVIVALPAEDDPIRSIPNDVSGGLHATILFFGDMDDASPIKAAVEEMLAGWQPPPFQQDTEGRMEPLGHDDPQAQVLMMSADARDSEYTLGNIRETLLANEDVKAAFDSIEQYPDFTPHITLGYGELDPEAIGAAEQLAEVTFDRLAVWHGEEQTEYPLGGGTMTDDNTEVPEVSEPVEAGPVPWHGVLAPEGIASGDGRRFTEGSLTHRDLPLPLTWQKISDDGHKGNVTVAKIEKVEMRDGLMRASGHFIPIQEADEVIGLIGEFGRFGVSVDADDATFEVNEEEEMVDFTSARVSSACIVSIPAFAEAFVALGPWDDEDETAPLDEEVPAEVDTDHTDEQDQSLAASIEAMRARSVEAAKTEDGPGWITHPVDTDRLRDYWVRDPKGLINWGVPGDFNRCRMAVAEYVKPQHLNGYCANRHYDALGIWPGQEARAGDSLEATEASDSISLVASAGGWSAPSDWFKDPGLTEPTPLTVTPEGRVFGHLAEWGTCHIGFEGQCVTPPKSRHDYAYFLTGQVALDDGGYASVGQITMGGGHAKPRLGLRAALAHYDSTSAAVCDITLGEDDHGIWFSGWVRPGVDDDMVTALRAGSISGDWRKVAGNLELIAALGVNVPGFPIPRPAVAASSEGQLSLVAAGVVAPRETVVAAPQVDVDALAAAVIAALDARESRKARMAALAARIEGN